MANIRDDELDFEGADHPPAENADSEDEIRRAQIPLEEMPGRLHRNIQEFKNQNSVTQAGQEIPNEIDTRPLIPDEIKDREAGPSQNNSQEDNRERLSPDPRLYKILADEMFAAIQGRGTSMIFRPQHFTKTARLLVDRGFHSVQAIKRMKTQLRTYFVDELKKAQVPTEDVRLVFELFDIFPPITRGSGKQHEFEEVCIPTALRRYTPDLSQLTGVIKPDQLMVNEISKQMTAAANTVPPYVPFVTVDRRPFRHPLETNRVRTQESTRDLEISSTRLWFQARHQSASMVITFNQVHLFSRSLWSMGHLRGPSCPIIRPSGGTVNGSHRVSTDCDRIRSKAQELCFRNGARENGRRKLFRTHLHRERTDKTTSIGRKRPGSTTQVQTVNEHRRKREEIRLRFLQTILERQIRQGFVTPFFHERWEEREEPVEPIPQGTFQVKKA